MRNCCLILVFLSLLALADGAGASDRPSERLWPMAAEPAVSSNFCEYRDGHLHAGIDIRSFGREGIECVAAADGYVSRVRATPSGYGKVVYLQLDDGQTLVYAHLSQFSPAIDSAVVAHQRRSGRYNVDFRPPKDRLRVARGDIIAYSGSTGGVDPHLHFEVRNAREHPLDPLAHGFALVDTLRPIIERIAFVPLDASARINGQCFPAEYAARHVGVGSYAVDDTVNIVGGVGLQALAVDILDADSGRLAPRTIELFLDGALVTRLSFEAFSFADGGQVGFVYDIGRIHNQREYWYQLYERVGESLWNRRFMDGGRLPTDSLDHGGVYPLRVVVTDVSGNTSELRAFVRRSTVGLGATSSAQVSELPGTYFFEGLMSADHEFQLAIDDVMEAIATGVTDAGGGVVQATDLPPGVFELRGAGGSPSVCQIAAVVAGEGRTLSFPELGMQLEIGTRTAYTDNLLYARSAPAVVRDQLGGLVPRRSPVQIGPYSLNLKADMTIRFAVGMPDTTTAIFRQSDRSGKWLHYPSTMEGDTVSTTAKRPGVYAVFSDRTPAEIRKPAVRQRLIYATGLRVPELQIPIVDSGSGVDYKRCAVFLDGIKQIARWDGRAKKLFVLIRDKNIMGPRAMSVVAYDNIGHRTQLDTTVDIQRRK